MSEAEVLTHCACGAFSIYDGVTMRAPYDRPLMFTRPWAGGEHRCYRTDLEAALTRLATKLMETDQ